MKRFVYLNNKFINFKTAKISIEDRGFQFADSVYEVIAFKEDNLIDINFHLKRLKFSLKSISIRYKFTNSSIIKIFNKLIKMNKKNIGLLYLQISRGVQSRSHIYKNNIKPTIVIYILEKKFNPNIKNIKCVSAITYPDLRWKKRDIKSVSLLPNIIAAKEAGKQKAYEAILIENGYVTEGTASNIWIVKNNYLITHPSNSDILKGITRDSIIKIIKNNNLKFKQKKFKKELLYNSDEVFLTSSSSMVMPINKIDNKIISNGKIGKITYKLAKLYNLKIN
ncbi:MAG: D-alanine aminotransferase [Alphaproteobacteria bacterium MarineAlpha5_Bin11]|nr:hypothetical protein [Pelagibacteraceae bacterium]PPR43929.1 MAG: D-alanine aminotransferase [Alphaproteobacteria bacterium MarineAlpha5_Bin11]|tara:strand:- start:20026 stop:20865 length:840 start_codon:yes stop_codon:yes gene_type:complete